MAIDTLSELLLLIGVGFLAGLLNVLAGGGSLLTLPVLLWLGLPAPVANASNRISLVMQNVTAVTAFQSGAMLPWRPTFRLLIPALPGAVLGAQLAVDIDERTFRLILLAILVFALYTMLRPSVTVPSRRGRRRTAAMWLGFFAMGFYAGFIQAGLGLLLLSLLSGLGGFDLVRSNAIKVTWVLLVQIVSLVVFGLHDTIHWGAGASLALGSASGAWAAAHWQMARGSEWVRRVVVVLLVVFALRLAWESFLA